MTDNGVVVLQVCVDLPNLVPDSRSETCQTSLCDGNEATVVKVEDRTDIQEEKDPLLIYEVSCERVIICTCSPPPSKKLAVSTKSFRSQQAAFLYFMLPLCSLSI
jgi:hypothetical protein